MKNTIEPNTVKDGQSESKEAQPRAVAATKHISTEVDIKKLLEAGAHFGHKTSRWHPKMAPYIHSKREGMLTNVATMGGRIKHLKDLESRMISGELAARYNKLEVQRFQEEIDSMNELYGGIKELAAKPGAVFVVDVLNDINAVREARKLHVPVVALADTNVDPTIIDYPIPCNDDATKTINLVLDYVQQAIMAGKNKTAKAVDKTEKPEEKPKAEAKKEEK
jgi:small subunit ribosomal protein S2